MSINIERLREIYENIENISEIDTIKIFPTDYNRRHYLLSELRTLNNIIGLVEKNFFKESFILLRTVFEKFMFFWLMFEGKRYRWTTTYKIIPNKNNNPKDARDITYQMWENKKKDGDVAFENVKKIDCSKQDKIIVTYEFEGLKDKIKPKNEIKPIYNFILEEYKPENAHLSSVENLSENSFPFIISYSDKNIQKYMYNNFFYIKNLIRNLKINNLVDNTMANRINVHYNFMSKYVHPSKASIDIWLQFNKSSYPNYSKINSDIYRELILLYICRLIYLYLKTYVNYYKNDDNKKDCEKYENLIEELNRISNDIWFFDNGPLQYDIDKSNIQKQILKQSNRPVSNDIHYPKNPLERLNQMRNKL